MVAWAGIDVGKRILVAAVVGPDGVTKCVARLETGPDGVGELMRLLREHGGRRPARLPVAVEDPHGTLVAGLVSRGYPVYAIHPVASARFRERLAAAGAKDDKRDAIALANLIRTEPHAHRRVANNTPMAQTLYAAARAQKEQVKVVKGTYDRLHGCLQNFYPGALEALPNLSTKSAHLILGLAPTPAKARRLTEKRLRRVLHEAHIWGRSPDVATVLTTLRQKGLALPADVEAEYGVRVLQLLETIEREEEVLARCTTRLVALFAQHPSHAIYNSFPALGGVLGARILGELGDDLDRFHNARGMAALAGVRPITKASGGHTLVKSRLVYNRNLGSAVYTWSLLLTQNSMAAKAYHDRCRGRGDSYNTALRKLAAAYMGILRACLRDGMPYDEDRAYQRFYTEAADAEQGVTAKASIREDAVTRSTTPLRAPQHESAAGQQKSRA